MFAPIAQIITPHAIKNASFWYSGSFIPIQKNKTGSAMAMMFMINNKEETNSKSALVFTGKKNISMETPNNI